MRWLSRSLLTLVATPGGVFVLAALDSTLFVSVPFGIDAAVVMLAARLGHHTAWIVPVLATTGSLAGAALTFWMGAVAGENGLDRYVSAKRLARVRKRIHASGTIVLAALDLIPPPFPFTPFVLAAGAVGVSGQTFFSALAICRLFRFGLETALAIIYGPRILQWLDSDIFHDIVMGSVLLAVVLTAASIVSLVRSSSRARSPRVA